MNTLQSGGPAKAFDDNPDTFWHTSWKTNKPHPHHLAIDLGKVVKVSGIIYLPRQDKLVANNLVETGSIEVNNDGKSWCTVGNFTFGNLVNDPSQKTFLFKKSRIASYVCLISKTGARGKPYAGAAEIGVLSE